MRTPVRHKGASTQGGRRRQVLFALPLLIVAFWWTHQPSRPGTKVVDSRAAKPVHGTKEALQTATKQTEHAEVLDLQQAGADAGAADAAARQPPHDSRTNAEKAAAHEPQGLDAEDGSGKGPGASAALPQQPHCSEERRAETLEGVLGGELPPVMSWGCNLLPQCDERFVAQTAEYLRATPRFASLLSLLPCDLWALICGRTLWLAGDSQSQRFYAQLRCFLADYAAEGQAGKEVPAVKDEQQRKSLSEALATEAGAAAVLPSCTLLAGGTRLCLARADTGEHMLRHLHHLKGLGLAAGDIWEFNVGLRHHQEEGEYGRLVAQLADYYSQHRQQLPTLIWRDTPPQHFDTQNGEAPHPAEAAEALEGHSICRPIRDVELQPDGSLAGDNAYVQGGGWRNQAATPLFEAAGMPIHHIWNDTVPLHGGHAAGECSDFCSPGAYGLHTWSLWSLLAELQREGRLPPPVAADDAAAAAADGQQPNPLGSQRDAVAAAAAAEAAAGTAAAVAAPRTAQAADNDRAINLAAKANRLLSRRMTWRSAASPYFRCKPDSLQLTPLTDGSLEHLLRGIAEPEPQVVWVNVTSVPCSRLDPEGDGTLLPGCCSQPFSFRVNSTDILVFQQIFRHHYLRALYVLMKGHEPRYILDAGANAGFSTALFKLLWPNTTVVSLEPDPSNFAALQRNTAEFEGVHRVRAGLWGRRANITQVFDDGDWGKIFRESAPGQPGLPALSVADVAAEYGIPAFDYVKIDIEGAEGMVFAPGADVSWIQGTKLVSLEVHDSFAKHFGLKAVTGRVDAAFSGLNFSMSSDNEHIYYIHADILPPSRITTRTSTTAAARWQG